MISSRESDVKIAMNRASPTVIALLSLFLVAAASDNSTHNSVNVIVPLTTGRDSGNGFHLLLHYCFPHQVKPVPASLKQYRISAKMIQVENIII